MACLLLGIWAGGVTLNASEGSQVVLGLTTGVITATLLRPIVRILLKVATSIALKRYRPHPMSTYFGPSA